MLFATAHRNRQLFADVRTYWSPDAVKHVTDHDLSEIVGRIIHLITPVGGAGLDRRTDRDGNRLKRLRRSLPRGDAVLARQSVSFVTEYFPGALVYGFTTRAECGHHVPSQPVKGLGPSADREGYTIDLPVMSIITGRTHTPDLADDLFVPIHRQGLCRRLLSDEQLGPTWRHLYGHIGGDLITLPLSCVSGGYAQCSGGGVFVQCCRDSAASIRKPLTIAPARFGPLYQ